MSSCLLFRLLLLLEFLQPPCLLLLHNIPLPHPLITFLENMSFLLFSWSITIYIRWNYIILAVCFPHYYRGDCVIFVVFIFSLLSCWCCLSYLVNLVFLVLSILYFSPCWFYEFLWLFLCVELAVKWFSLVNLSYQLHFNSRRRRYVVYELNIWSQS